MKTLVGGSPTSVFIFESVRKAEG